MAFVSSTLSNRPQQASRIIERIVAPPIWLDEHGQRQPTHPRPKCGKDSPEHRYRFEHLRMIGWGQPRRTSADHPGQNTKTRARDFGTSHRPRIDTPSRRPTSPPAPVAIPVDKTERSACRRGSLGDALLLVGEERVRQHHDSFRPIALDRFEGCRQCLSRREIVACQRDVEGPCRQLERPVLSRPRC